MSIPLGPYTPVLQQTIRIDFPFQPDRVKAVLIANITPFLLQVGGLPGVSNIWHTPWKEELYFSSDSNPFASSLSLFALAGQTGVAPIRVFSSLLVTIFEVGEEVPGTYPVMHGEYPSLLNEGIVKLSNAAVSLTSSSGGQNGSLVLSPDALAYIAVQGFNIMFDNTSSAHTCMVTLTVGDQATLSFRTTQSNVSNGTILHQEFGAGLQSLTVGLPATLSIPSVSSGANWSAAMWGYELFSPQ